MSSIRTLLGNLLILASLAGLAALALESPGAPVQDASPEATSGDSMPPTAPPGVLPTATSEPAAPATAQPAQAPPAASFPIAFDERFADNRMDWPDDRQSTAWLADGVYRLRAQQPSRFVAVGAPLPGPLRDVVVSARFRKVGGPPGGGYGVIVRDQGSGPRDGLNQGGRYYVLEVGDQGEVGIWRREEDHWVDLLPWTPSEAVRRGAANELEVRASGQRLSLLVNGVPVASHVDPVLEQGAVGVFVGGDSNEVALEWLAVRSPTEAGSTPGPLLAGERPGGGADPMNSQPSVPAIPTTVAPMPFLPITKVAIPRISLQADAVPAKLVDKDGALTWEVPAFKAGHAEDTTGAGAPGNAVLVGHVTSRNSGNIFRDLDRVRAGDLVQVSSGERRFDYRVVDARTVDRTDVSVVRATETASVSLITCTGVWLPVIWDYSERLIVRAELVP